MAESFKLGRTRQCAGCPWKVSTVPAEDIPFYDADMHEDLRGTIAEPGAIPVLGQPVRTMMCHEHVDSKPERCVGWLLNQLGEGNNIGLRMRMAGCTNLQDVRLDGPQHTSFDDTLPT